MGGIIELEPSDFGRVASLFDVFDHDRSLVGGVLEGNQIGRIFCEDAKIPQFAALFHPGDYGYLVGDPASADLQALAIDAPRGAGVEVEEQEFLVPMNTTWIAHFNAAFGDRIKRSGYEYFTFTDAKADWIRKWPERVPEGIEVVLMDLDLAQKAEKIFQIAAVESWGSAERFVERAFGFVIRTASGELAGAISTFALGEGEAEIDIATHKNYRRQGLATLMGCAFIEHCLDRGLIPAWTANFGNFASMATARKLGFVDRFILPCFKIKDAK